MQDYRDIVIHALADRSVNWLSKASGVPQRTVADWISGDTDSINSVGLAKIAEVLGLEMTVKKSRKKSARILLTP